MLSERLSALRTLASAAGERSFVPYSGRRDAAVLLLSDGSWIPGVRVESASFSLSIPPLLNAVTTAVALDRLDVVAASLARPLHASERAFASASPVLSSLSPSATDMLVDEKASIPSPAQRLSPFVAKQADVSAQSGIQMARDAARRAYVPESQFPVGCVVCTAEFNCVPGVNVENPDWTYILCAERNALGTCISYGIDQISTLWVSCLNDPQGTPCGACRQLLVELAPTATLWMDRGDQPPAESDPVTLLPGSFSGEQLTTKT